MTKERANLGFSDALDDLSPNEWSPPARQPARERPDPTETAKAAASAGFGSREPKLVQPPYSPSSPDRAGQGRPRRRKPTTGRNTQFNMRAHPDTIDAYYAIADANGWGLGETLEKAVELLEARYGDGTSDASPADQAD